MNVVRHPWGRVVGGGHIVAAQDEACYRDLMQAHCYPVVAPGTAKTESRAHVSRILSVEDPPCWTLPVRQMPERTAGVGTTS